LRKVPDEVTEVTWQRFLDDVHRRRLGGRQGAGAALGVGARQRIRDVPGVEVVIQTRQAKAFARIGGHR